MPSKWDTMSKSVSLSYPIFLYKKTTLKGKKIIYQEVINCYFFKEEMMSFFFPKHNTECETIWYTSFFFSFCKITNLLTMPAHFLIPINSEKISCQHIDNRNRAHRQLQSRCVFSVSWWPDKAIGTLGILCVDRSPSLEARSLEVPSN